MVIISVKLKGNLDNVSEIRPGDGMSWALHLKCSTCGTESPKVTIVDPKEEVEIEGSRGTANVVQSCKECTKRGTISLVPGSITPYTTSGEWATVARMEMRGWEPVRMDLKDGWYVKGQEQEWEDVELEGGDWGDYDEEAGVGVMIEGLEVAFEVSSEGSGKSKRRAKK